MLVNTNVLQTRGPCASPRQSKIAPGKHEEKRRKRANKQHYNQLNVESRSTYIGRRCGEVLNGSNKKKEKYANVVVHGEARK